MGLQRVRTGALSMWRVTHTPCRRQCSEGVGQEEPLRNVTAGRLACAAAADPAGHPGGVQHLFITSSVTWGLMQCGMTHQRERRRQRMSWHGEEPPLPSGPVHFWFGTFQGRCKVAQRTLDWRFKRRTCGFIVLVNSVLLSSPTMTLHRSCFDSDSSNKFFFFSSLGSTRRYCTF